MLAERGGSLPGRAHTMAQPGLGGPGRPAKQPPGHAFSLCCLLAVPMHRRRRVGMVNLGDKVPEFSAETTKGPLPSFHDFCRGKWTMLFRCGGASKAGSVVKGWQKG